MRITTKYLLGAIVILLFGTLSAFSFSGNKGFELAKQEVILRQIGHNILLHSGDSTSRVLPVKTISDNEYQLTFENDFTFQPDSLVDIIRSCLAKNSLSHDYIVNVLNCSGNAVIFGYAIFNDEKNDIVPCIGRKQPKSCYLVNVKFSNSGITATQKGYLFAGLSVFVFAGLLFTRFNKKSNKPAAPVIAVPHVYTLGNTVFDAKKRTLVFAGIIAALTHKESKLLLIFALSPNTVIERARLQKEIWEDEGVIVGRSLDVFISKLRKKLENDAAIQIANIHGKGYRLEVSV